MLPFADKFHFSCSVETLAAHLPRVTNKDALEHMSQHVCASLDWWGDTLM